VGDKAASLVDAMEAMDDVAAKQTQRSFGSFRQEFGPSFTLDESTGDLRDWGPKLNGNFTQVDKFAAASGGVATVFAAKGTDFERITTSLKNKRASARWARCSTGKARLTRPSPPASRTRVAPCSSVAPT
jgi:methyl-accepting chemotaxis protein-2 (aspartate sensor receptor)